jgi:hypothetical protein
MYCRRVSPLPQGKIQGAQLLWFLFVSKNEIAVNLSVRRFQDVPEIQENLLQPEHGGRGGGCHSLRVCLELRN